MMILIQNAKKVSLETIHQKLANDFKEYKYTLKADFLTISDPKHDIELNILFGRSEKPTFFRGWDESDYAMFR